MDNRVYCLVRQNFKAEQEHQLGDALKGHRKDTSLVLCSSAPALSYVCCSIYMLGTSLVHLGEVLW